jgi:hypothetical protein
MDRRFLIGMTCVAILGVGAWTLAQGQQPGGKAPTAEAPFLVSATGDTSVLVDTKSGRTWVLTRAVDGESVWLPAQRIETLEEARNWRVAQKRLGEERIFIPKK